MKAKNAAQSCATLRWEGVIENTMDDRHHGCPGGVPCNIQSKERLGTERGHGSDAMDLPEGKILMMMMK